MSQDPFKVCSAEPDTMLMEGAEIGLGANDRKPQLSTVERALRVGYYVLFWYLPYHQFPTGGRRFVRRLSVAATGLAAAVYAVQGATTGVVVAVVATLMSHASLRLVDRAIAGGPPVPRTRFNLPADLEPPAGARPQ